MYNTAAAPHVLAVCAHVQVLAENQALVDFKHQVAGLKVAQDAEFVARQKEALAVSAVPCA